MAQGIRVIVLNCDEEYSAQLRTKLLGVDGVKIVAEVDEPLLFQNAVEQLPAEVAFINLDPDPEGLLILASEVAQQYPDLCIFGISQSDNPRLIMEAMRAGMREFLLRPIDQEQLTEALSRVARLRSSNAVRGKVICVVGTTGGCGATVLATNLACELAQLSKRGVALVDLDLMFGHVATLLDVSPQFTIADLCATLEHVDPNMVEKALVRHDTGVHVLAKPFHFAQAQQITVANCVTVLNVLGDMFEYVVCDGPLRSDASGRVVLDMADMAIMVVQLLVNSIRNVDRLMHELASEGYNLDRLKLVVNRYGKEYSPLHPEDVEQTLNRKVFYVLPSDWKSASSSVNMGQPLCVIAPKSRIREAIADLALKIYDPDAYERKRAGEGKSGLLAKVLGK